MISFNRTSMESKLCSTCCIFRFFALLIEPVWNRNLDDAEGERGGLSATFNRTSMESKLS